MDRGRIAVAQTSEWSTVGRATDLAVLLGIRAVSGTAQLGVTPGVTGDSRPSSVANRAQIDALGRRLFEIFLDPSCRQFGCNLPCISGEDQLPIEPKCLAANNIPRSMSCHRSGLGSLRPSSLEGWHEG